MLTEEPMSLVLNLGMSAGFVRVDWENITFPATFLIDYVRVNQDEDAIDIGCDRECCALQAVVCTADTSLVQLLIILQLRTLKSTGRYSTSICSKQLVSPA